MAGSVTGRALAVLAAFSATHPEPTLTEISRRTGLPLTTTHRLLGELTAWGAVERVDGRYRVGLRLWEVASLAPRALGLRDAAMPFLEDVHAATRHHTQLAVLADGSAEVVYVERLSARSAVSVVNRVGGRLPWHATAVGRVLLAHADPAVQETALAGPLPWFTPATVTDADELRRALADVRSTGVAVCEQQIETVSLSVAAPVRGRRGQVVAALSVVVPMAAGARPYVPVVLAGARGISRALGRRPSDQPDGAPWSRPPRP